jgi:putative intracellular protease/amidase
MKPLPYALAFALPVLVVIASAQVALIVRAQHVSPPPAVDQPLPAPPAHDPAKRTALVVAGNAATESSDLLGPYEVLATSGAFNLYVVAPERRLTPLVPQPHCCGPLDLVPHYSFAEYDRAIGVGPDLIVVPFIPYADTADAAVLTWLRERPGNETVILSICGGAKMVADAGLFAGHRATSHATNLPILARTHPEVTWVRGVRYVDDGRVISSAGVTSGVDATLHTLHRFRGRAAAEETAARVGYAYTGYLDDATWQVPDDGILAQPGPFDAAVWPNAFRWDRTQIGVVLYSGVREIELASIVDAYPRSTSADVHTLGLERTFVRTRHGLDLLPRFDLASAPTLDRVLLPGQLAADVAGPVERWAATHVEHGAERIHESGGYPYDVTFRDLARQETRPVAASAARWLEYPVAPQAWEGRNWAPELLLRAAGVGLLGVIVVAGVQRARLPDLQQNLAEAVLVAQRGERRGRLGEREGAPDLAAQRAAGEAVERGQ